MNIFALLCKDSALEKEVMKVLLLWLNLLNRLSARLQWLILALLLLLTAVFTFYIFPHFDYRQFESAIRILDVRIWYSAAVMQQLFADLGAEGRALYWFQTAVIDMVYPLIYGLLFVFIILRFGSINLKNRWIAFWHLSVFLAPLMDYLENFNTLLALTLYPETPSILALSGSLLTGLKWLNALAAFLLLFFTIVVWSLNRFTKKSE